MKKDLHPKYKKISVQCITCGETFEINSTIDEIKVDVCSNCHPFYTGKLGTGSKAGRIERFNKKFNKKD